MAERSVEVEGVVIPLVGTRFVITAPLNVTQQDMATLRTIAGQLASAISADEPFVAVLPHGYHVEPLEEGVPA